MAYKMSGRRMFEHHSWIVDRHNITISIIVQFVVLKILTIHQKERRCLSIRYYSFDIFGA